MERFAKQMSKNIFDKYSEIAAAKSAGESSDVAINEDVVRPSSVEFECGRALAKLRDESALDQVQHLPRFFFFLATRSGKNSYKCICFNADQRISREVLQIGQHGHHHQWQDVAR